MSDAAPARGALLADAASLLRPLLGLGVLFLLPPGLQTPWLLVAVLLAFWVLSRMFRGLIRRALTKRKMSKLAKDFFIQMSGRVVMALGFITAIAQLGVEVEITSAEQQDTAVRARIRLRGA